ncbi:hypothetical protein AtNW77_Chr1g0012641 [Arabidopsis thaliana]
MLTLSLGLASALAILSLPFTKQPRPRASRSGPLILLSLLRFGLSC